MEKTQRFDDQNVKLAINEFMKFLRKTEDNSTFAHVIFRCGTVVRLDCEAPAFERFDDNYDFPNHCTDEKTKETIFQENKHDWEWAQTLSYSKLIAKAYYILINDGYPYPGGDGADRNCVSVNPEKTCMITVFLNRRWKDNIFTLSYLDRADVNSHQTIGAMNRRYDYIMPQIYAIIDDKLKLHLFE